MAPDMNYKKDFPPHIEQGNPAMDDFIARNPYGAKIVVAISSGNTGTFAIKNFVGIDPCNLISALVRQERIKEGESGYAVNKAVIGKLDETYLRNNVHKIDAQILQLTR